MMLLRFVKTELMASIQRGDDCESHFDDWSLTVIGRIEYFMQQTAYTIMHAVSISATGRTYRYKRVVMI